MPTEHPALSGAASTPAGRAAPWRARGPALALVLAGCAATGGEPTELAGPVNFLADATTLALLDERYPGVILETWFTRYKGPGRLVSRGMEGLRAAHAVVREAAGHFEATAARAAP